MEVTVVERAAGSGRQASFANAALLTPSLADPWNAPGIGRALIKCIGREDAPILLRLGALPSLIGWGFEFLRSSSEERFRDNFRKNVALARYNLDVLHALQTEVKLQFDHAARGTLRVFRDHEALRSAIQSLAQLRDTLGLPSRQLDRHQLLETEPALLPIATELVGAIHYPGDECGDAHQYCEQLAGVAASDGVRFRFGTTVTKLRAARNRIEAAFLSNGAAIEADVFVLAAGSYSSLLARPLGVHLPVRPAKGYSITAPRGDWPDGPGIPVIDDRLHAAVVPLGDRIRVAGTAELAGYDLSIRPARIENLVNLLGAVYPNYASRLDPTKLLSWTGLRPMSADGVPILGETRISNLVLNTGHGHLGWSMAAASGKVIADLIAGVPLDIPLQEYGLQRFA